MVLGGPVLDERQPVRRIRQDALDGISVAALSLASSLVATALFWALARWLE